MALKLSGNVIPGKLLWMLMAGCGCALALRLYLTMESVFLGMLAGWRVLSPHW